MRIFIGIPISDEIREGIAKISENFDIDGIKLVNPQNLHWTVKFFGDINKETVNEIKEMMDRIELNSFDIDIGGIGVFPSLSYIRTIWVGVLGEEKIFMNFLIELNEKFKKYGKENRHRIKPHLTIGRVKFIKDKEKLIKLVKMFERKYIGKMKINKISLFESILTKNGPKYTTLKEVVLK